MAPTATPNPDAIVFEDDRLVVTMDECVNDTFYVSTSMHISVKDPSRHVLVTNAAALTNDPREAILVVPKQDCVTYEYASGMRSFDVTDTSNSVYKRFQELEKSFYHAACFDVEMLPQPDGSILLQTSGDTTSMRNEYHDVMAILTALTFTDPDGQTGRTEIFSRILPSAPQPLKSAFYSPQVLSEELTFKLAYLYYMEEYAYLSIQYTGSLAPDCAMLGCAEYPALNGLSAIPIQRKRTDLSYSTGYLERNTQTYKHLIFRLDPIPTSQDIDYLTLDLMQDEQLVKQVTLVRNGIGKKDGPTHTPILAAAETPAPSAAPLHTSVATPTPALPPAPTEPPHGLSTFVHTFAAYASTSNYRPYTVKLRMYGDWGFLNVYFSYRGTLPDNAFVQLTEVNGVEGTYGQATIVPADLTETSASILCAPISCDAITEDVESARAVCIDPATGETLFTLRLEAKEEIIRPNATYIAPTPSPQNSGTIPPDAAPTPTAVPTATPIPPDTVLGRYSLKIADKPVKYSHYNANLLFYPENVTLVPHFRYHDPLPEGTMLRVVEHNGTPGEYGSALIGPANLENASPDLLGATISIGLLPDGHHTFRLEAIHPDTSEVIFEVTLKTEQSVKIQDGYYWGDYGYTSPSGTIVYPTRPPYYLYPTATPYNPFYPGYTYPGYNYPSYNYPGYSYPGYGYPGYNWGWSW